MTFRPAAIFERSERHDGVRNIHVSLLRLVYGLMFFVLGHQMWAEILTHQGAWETKRAVEVCVWAGFATVAGLGLLHPVKMLPILVLEVFYKVLWLLLVALPLWRAGTLAGSAAEGTTSGFLWVILPIAVMPWGYVFRTYVWGGGKYSRQTGRHLGQPA